jgi:hypothetical protein
LTAICGWGDDERVFTGAEAFVAGLGRLHGVAAGADGKAHQVS